MSSVAWFCAIGALAGVVLLVGNQSNTPNSFAGILRGMLSAVFYALYILISNKLRGGLRLNTSIQMLMIGMFTSLFLFGEGIVINTVYGFLILLGLGLTSQVMGQGFIAYSLAYISPKIVTLFLLLQPVVAIIMGWVIFSEELTMLQLLGAGIIMLFIYLAKFSFKSAL